MKNKGFTLIEVLIFTTLISFIFITLSYLAVNSIQNSKIGAHKILATHYAEELREVLRNQKEDDWGQFTTNDVIYPICYGPIAVDGSASTMSCVDDPQCTTCSLIVGNAPDAIFKRYARKTYYGPTDPLKPNQVDVDITVEWNDGGKIFRVPLNTVFAQNEGDQVAAVPTAVPTPTPTPAIPWLAGFSFRRPVTIFNSGSHLTNYQTLVTVNTQSLITAGKMRSDCGDIRFTDQDGITLISYWLEQGCNSATTKLWVKVPSVPTTIYVYYGNATAVSTSDFNNTFPLSYILSGTDTRGGSQNFDWFEVMSGAILTVNPNSLLRINARRVKITGTINGTGKGYLGATVDNGSGSGPGAGPGSNRNGAGAGYGGVGGCGPESGAPSCNVGGGSVYGTSNGTDIDQGSGGSLGDSPDQGGAGGAGISIIARSADVTGSIIVSGGDGVYTAGCGSFSGGGGSGGGILIQAVDINTTGATLQAQGGKAGNTYGGAGGGGRIKIFYSSSNTGIPTTNVAGATTNACDGGNLTLGFPAYGLAGTTSTTTFISMEPTTTIGNEEIP